MIRPDAKAQLMRWREVLIGAAALALGVWWLVGPGRLLALPAIALIVIGVALIWIGMQRARFRASGQGPGVIQVDEGQITYFGPLTGGTVALEDVTRITLDPSQYPFHWRLEQSGGQELFVPVNAEGADLLYDAFATLPGFRMENALAALKTSEKHPILIWQRDVSTFVRLGLH